MSYLFFDTSALVKRYHGEQGTARVDSLVEDETSTVVITSLAVVEATSAFRRKYNAGDLTEEEMQTLIAAFFDEGLSDFLILPMDDDLLDVASKRGLSTTNPAEN